MTDTNKLEQNFKLTYDSKIEQVDASVRFVLKNNRAFYDSLGNLPSRVASSLLQLVLENPEHLVGYHYRILQKAYSQFARGAGFIGSEEAPFHDY